MSELRRVQVWSGPLRAAHWAMAVCVLVLLASAWLMGWGREADAVLRVRARGAHVLAGEILALALALRFGLLLLGRASDGWRDLIPRGAQLQGVKAMVRFYLARGRTRMPGYFGHNPLWGPVYLALLVLLLLQTLAGLWMVIAPVRGALALPPEEVLALHRGASWLVLGFTLAHLLAVILHDWRGGRWEISAMLNGQKVLEIERPGVGPEVGGETVQRIRVDDIGHWRPPEEGR